MPPWPGIIVPVSLIFERLFKYEIKISPNWLEVLIKNADIIKYSSKKISVFVNEFKSVAKKNVNKIVKK